MNRKKKFVFLCSLILLWDATAESPLPVSKWIVKTSGKAELSAREENGTLRLDFNIRPDRLERSGHRVFYLGEADLLLKDPQELSPETERILFEFSNSPVRSDCEITLRPLVRDSDGEIFIFQPHAFPHLNSGGKTWGTWITSSFYSGEAGAPTHDIYSIEGKTKNYTPDGTLAFLGFKLTLRRYTANNPKAAEKKPLRGSVHLGDFQLFGQRIPYSHPFAYADAFLTERGVFEFAVQIRNHFQAAPVSEFRKTLSFDPNNPASRRQKLVFPLGPDDNYWIDYQITDSKGGVVKSGFLRQQVLNNPDRTPLKPVNTRTPPSIGYLRINPDHQTCGVYRRPEAPVIELRIFPGEKRKLNLKWSLLAYDFPDVLDQGCSVLTFEGMSGKDSYRSLRITPRTLPDRDAYRLLAEVLDGGKTVDRQIYYFGFQTDPERRHDRAGQTVDRREIKQHPYNRTTYLLPANAAKNEAGAEQHFRSYLASSRQIAQSVTYMVDLVDFEVLPGVFNFAMLDRIMDAAADFGCKVTVRFAHLDRKGTNLYRWLKYSRQYNYDGTIAPGHPYYGAYAVTDPGTRKFWLSAYRALYNRYRSHTAFEGYYIMQPGGEWTVVDQPWMGTVTGYDPSGIAAFRAWMRKRFSLAELNRRWNTSYRTWEEVTVPSPDFRRGMKPDLRMAWIDFCCFKSALESEIWMPEAVNHIRSFDPDRITICYGSPDTLAKTLSGKLDYGHNGGNHYGNRLGEFIDAWEKHGIGWITEPHHPHRWAAYGDPADQGWVLDWSVWIMTAQAGGGGANLHVYYMPNPTLSLPAHYGGVFAYDAFEKFKPILAELHEMKILSPKKEIAVNQDRYTLYAKHRTTFSARLDDLKRWFELLDADSVPYETLVPEKLENYKLILPNILDEVISLENLELYDRAVRHGAAMIMTANTGKFVPELGPEPFQLLKKFGIEVPVSNYCRNGMAVTATAEKNVSPMLFRPGQKIAFQTADSFHAQLNSEEIRKNFLWYPYRWIPETDYFGYYPGQKITSGRVLAEFNDGGAAVSIHPVGKGHVIVFWGSPDIGDRNLSGMMSRAADWAGVKNPLKKNPFRSISEGKNTALNRHYLMAFQEHPGTYILPVPNVPDGDWFLDDPVSSMRLGRYDGKTLREKGLKLTWIPGYSPLKFIRMIPSGEIDTAWKDKYQPVSSPKRK